MVVPQEPGVYRDASGHYWSHGGAGWKWIGRRLPFTGRVEPVREGHGPLPEDTLAELAEDAEGLDEPVLPLTRVEVDDLPAELLQ